MVKGGVTVGVDDDEEGSASYNIEEVAWFEFKAEAEEEAAALA